ncbi:hypothetical protein Vafri_1062 [Volvox africanus]|nr:hypothetical protein Vafri_1062 [Volvox africanus]
MAGPATAAPSSSTWLSSRAAAGPPISSGWSTEPNVGRSVAGGFSTPGATMEPSSACAPEPGAGNDSGDGGNRGGRLRGPIGSSPPPEEPPPRLPKNAASLSGSPN